MTHKKVAIFALCFLATTTSFAFGMRNNNEISSEVNCMLNPESCLHQAAWYQDRDNSMSAVSTEEGVGAAMAVIMTLNGYTQGIQVCPGVYLATAHGALDNPHEARSEGRPYRDPITNSFRAIAYPMVPDNMMVQENDISKYTSPRLRDPSAASWNDPTTDYIFVKVDNPVRPNDFIRPVRADNQRLVEAANRGQMDVHLYRPQTRFNTENNGTPDFNSETWAKEVSEVAPLYQSPQRVDQPCQIVEGYNGLVGNDCPTEQAVSGSSNVTQINGENYLVGMHTHGSAASEESFDNSVPNAFVPSSSFCSDYESVCGQPCVDLNEVLPE